MEGSTPAAIRAPRCLGGFGVLWQKRRWASHTLQSYPAEGGYPQNPQNLTWVPKEILLPLFKSIEERARLRARVLKLKTSLARGAAMFKCNIRPWVRRGTVRH